jgi:hypothetical protein
MEKINTFINIIAGIVSIVSAVKAWGLKKQTEKLRDEISNRRDLHDMVLNLRYCSEKIGKLPARHTRGVKINEEVAEIEKLMSAVSQLAIASDAKFSNPVLGQKINDWKNTLFKYNRFYEQKSEEESILEIKHTLQSEIASMISNGNKYL